MIAMTSLIVAACGETSPVEQACIDTAEAVARSAERCGDDYKVSYDGFVQAAAAGDCGNVDRIRDEAALRDTCIPYLATISCDDLAAGTIDPTCAMQLVRLVPGASQSLLQSSIGQTMGAKGD